MKCRAYLDIETTGLSRHDCDLTVIGIGLERGGRIQVVQLLEDDLYEQRLLKALEGVDVIYNYKEDVVNLQVLRRRLGIR